MIFINKHLVSKCVKIRLKECLIKHLKREVETLDLYWFTQIKLCRVLLYTTVKGFTNKNFDYNQVFYPTTPDYTSILYVTLDTPLNSP